MNQPSDPGISIRKCFCCGNHERNPDQALPGSACALLPRRLRRYAAMLATFAALTAAGVPGHLAAQTDEGADTRPNILVFLSDDMGWGQPGFNGGTEVATPNIDGIANEGVKLTQFYVQPVCTATRASLLTGRYAWKNGTEKRVSIRASHGMLTDERTLAEALRDAGYATWIVGKWHLGHWQHKHLPLQRGFDHHYGMYSALIDSFTHRRYQILDWHRNERPVVESGYSTFLLADEAVALIERHDGSRPFFLYLPFNAVHDPYDAPAEYIAQYAHLGVYTEQRAMLKAMDVAIGQVMDALDRKGVLDDTLVMFLNDNGGTPFAGLNRPYQGKKSDYYEGGIRVPAAMRWPGHIPAGSESDALLDVVDLFPTFAGLAGAATGGGLPLDGLDAWETIAEGAESPREEVVHSLKVIRVGDWKLIEEDGSNYEGDELSPVQLYNMSDDPYEDTNLAASETEKVAELRARLAYHLSFARDGEPEAEIPDHPPHIYGAEENETFGTEARRAVTQLRRGNPGPALLRIEASGTSVKLVYDKALDVNSVPPIDAFKVVLNPGYRSAEVVGVEVSGSEVVLTLAQSAAEGETVGLTYEVPDIGAIEDADSLEAVGVTWVTATVTRAPSTDATLASLELSGIDIGSFASAVTSYVASVDYGVETTTVTATPNDAAAVVEILDAAGSTTGTSRSVSLVVGSNAITVEVTSEDGVTEQTYSATVTRAPPSLPPPPPPPPPPAPPPGGGGGGGLLFPPETPAGLLALPGDGAVRLEWSPPASDGGTAILRYEYRLKEGRGEFGEWTPIEDSAPGEANATGYTVGGLGTGTVYVFEVRAVNAAGSSQVSEAVEVRMGLDLAYWSNFRAEDLEGTRLKLEAFFSGGSGDREVRFGEALRFEEDALDGEGEVTATRMGGYGYRYTSRTTGRLPLDFDVGESCELRLTFRGEGEGSYVYRCGGSLEGQGSFEFSELNRVPEITSTGPFEVEENTTRVGQLEAVDWDEEDAVTGYGIAGGADGALFAIEAETGELRFREAPDYETPGDVESEELESGAGDNEYVVVVGVSSGEGERERRREQAIRVRVSDVEMEEAGEDETGALFVPVILSSAGRSQSFFTSELTLTNRGEQEVKLDYTYTARDEPEKRSGTASDVLAAGRQRIETDALTYLRGLGIPIPETGNQLGTLRVEVPLGSEVEAVVRTATAVPEGRAGLAYLGVGEEEGYEEAVYLCGLRQNSQDRSNVAFQNMGTSEEGAITLKTTVYSGEAGNAMARELGDVTLEPGEFHQYSGLLGTVRNGYVKVERVEGEAPFYAYGVINDQANSDGSFIFPVTASSLEGKMGQILPVVVETRDFTSELTVTNFSEDPRTLDFEFVSEQIKGEDKTAGFSMTLEAREQQIIPEVVEELRQRGVTGLGTSRGFYAGPLFAMAEEGDMSGIVIGARTGSEGGGGQYSVFYNAVPFGEAFSREAWVDGLQQNEENRSNLALVNTGEVDESPSVFHLEIYNGETGILAETVVTKPIPPRGWHQIDGILRRSSPETRQGYIRIEKVSGENPFLAYGVVNDGGAPGERSGDGAYLPAQQ